jgi:Na+/proline symporter
MTSNDKLKYCYYAFILCAVSSLIPQMMVQTFSMVFSIMMIIAFYVVRHKWDKETFEHKEASSLIKTFWIWSAIYVVGMFVAGGLISSFGDMTAMNEWTQSVVQGSVIPDEESMKKVTQAYMDANFNLIISMTILCLLPAQIYAALRIKQGLSRIANPPVTPPEAIIG